MQWLLKHETSWLARMLFILVSFFIFQSSIVATSANPINLELDYRNATYSPNTYDENESSAGIEDGCRDRVNWVVSKVEVGSKAGQNLG